MEMQIITVYCICDDLVIFFEIKDDIQVTMSTSEILTTAIVAGMFFRGNHEHARNFLKEYNYIPNMLSKCQFNRRLHAIPEHIYQTILGVLGNFFKNRNESQEYSVDSFQSMYVTILELADRKFIMMKNIEENALVNMNIFMVYAYI